MPYIKQDRRVAVDRYRVALDDPFVTFMAADVPQDCGELNYALTMICLDYKSLQYNRLDWLVGHVLRDYLADKGLRYQRINDVAGACLCAMLEIKRRRPKQLWAGRTLIAVAESIYDELGVPYEMTKIKENGDIAAYGDSK